MAVRTQGSPARDDDRDALFSGPGEMRARCRAFDWAATPLGPVAEWPQSLRSAVDICLGSAVATYVWWGRDLIQIYNDAAICIVRSQHPASLGVPARAAWADVWPVVGGTIEGVLTSGNAVGGDDVPMVMERGGPLETAWFTFSYSPVRDESGAVAGVFCTALETTTRVRAEAALRASELRYRALATATTDVMYRMSPDWHEMRQLDGRGFLSDTPIPSDAWIARYIHPDDQSRVTAAINEAIEHRRPLVLEHRVIRADGALGWTLSRAVPLLGEQGEIVEWIGAATDITADRTAERDTVRRQLAEVEEAERRRLSRELHDELGQEVTAFRLGLEDATRLAAECVTPNAALLERLAQLQMLAERMTLGIRAIALELRPPELDDVGLAAALETYVADWTTRYGVAADVAVIGVRDRAIPADVGSAVYRIAQEALTNVAKHAGASQVSVILEQPDHEVRLIVEDDGRGFDPAETTTRSRLERRLGLPGMQERAALVGGTLTVESRPGAGTSLYVRLPIRAPADSEGAVR